MNLVKEFYSALNRNDLPALLTLVHPQILRVEFEGTPHGSTYQGADEFRDHVEDGRSNWAEGSCTPEKFIVAADKVVVYVHVRVRLKDKVEWNEGRIADGFRIEDDKIIEFRSFLERKDALTWAGASDS